MKLIHIPLLVVGVQGHGSMIMPDSRNSVDASPGMPWANGKHPETGLIEPYTCACGNGTDVCSSGQVFICDMDRFFVCTDIQFLGMNNIHNFHECVVEELISFTEKYQMGNLHIYRHVSGLVKAYPSDAKWRLATALVCQIWITVQMNVSQDLTHSRLMAVKYSIKLLYMRVCVISKRKLT